VIDAFVEMLNLADIGFDGVIQEETGRPRYHLLARRLAPDFKTIGDFFRMKR
jgi:hypothetical protein